MRDFCHVQNSLIRKLMTFLTKTMNVSERHQQKVSFYFQYVFGAEFNKFAMIN